MRFLVDAQLPEGDKRGHGYSRDHRPDCPQLVITWVVTAEGLPVTYEVLPILYFLHFRTHFIFYIYAQSVLYIFFFQGNREGGCSHFRRWLYDDRQPLAHRRWLASHSFAYPAQQIVFEDAIEAIEEAVAGRRRLGTAVGRDRRSLSGDARRLVPGGGHRRRRTR